MRAGVVRGGIGAVVLALTASLLAVPAVAAPPELPPVVDQNPAGPQTEATIVDMIHTSGLFGGDVPTATALTPYPTSGLQNQRSVTTAQIVLEDPQNATAQTALTYCIDLDTETTIGIHYELGDWTEANVPNLAYVQWILANYYPQVPTAPIAGTDAEKVRAVQGAIWYFTDQFVVSSAYPSERGAVAAIVAAAQTAVDPTPVPPVLPTLTVTPAEIEASAPGQIVGPFVVGGSVAAATLVTRDTEVFADASGTQPIADGATVAPGDSLWARFDPAIAGQGFELTALTQILAGNVFLYDGNNPPRTSAQKLVLAADTQVAIRASAAIVAEDSGALRVDVAIGGAAAGSQGEIALEAQCVAEGGWQLTRPAYVPAGTAAGTIVVMTIPDIPAGAVCTLVQTNDGSTADAVLSASTVDPVSVVVGSDATSTITLANTYVAPPGQTGAVAVIVSISGQAAGSQSALSIEASCVDGDSRVSDTFTVAAGSTGTVTAGTLPSVPAGSVCTATQTADGANRSAVLTSSTVTPASVTIVADTASTITIADVFAVPAPSPTPTPTRTALPDTGAAAPLPWGWAALALMLGAAVLAVDGLRRRRHS